MTPRLRADLALVGVTAIWGATFILIKDALESVGPLWFVALRFALAGLVLAPFGLRGGGGWAGGVIAGAFLFTGYALQTVGLQYTSASRAGFITGLTVVFVPIAVAAHARSWPRSAVGVGMLLALTGMALLTLSPSDVVEAGPGDLLMLGCAVAFTGQILATGRFARVTDPGRLAFVQIGSTAILSLALAVAAEPLPLAPLLPAVPAILFTALLATVGAYWVQSHAQRFTSATHAALIFAMEPVFGALFAAALGGERLTERELLGCGMILAGMLVAGTWSGRRVSSES